MTDSVLIHMRFGRYEIRDRLGAGGMARVFKGYDANLERLVAIKVMHDHLAEDPTFKERFEREAKFIASLDHPNIVQVYDFDAVDMNGQPIYYMVMPYIPGKSLKGILDDLESRGEHPSESQVIEIIRALADALGYAHARGMVHRDVKPANILFNERGQAVLTDFGIARLVQNSNLTGEGVTTGTPAYMSPEQVVGLPVDARSDIYALGVITFELLTGRLPYLNDENSVAVMLKHVNAPLPRISEFLPAENPYLDAVMYRVLAKSPDERHPSTQAFFADLMNALAGDMQTTPPFLETQTTKVLAPTQIMAEPAPPRKLAHPSVGLLAVGVTVIVFIGAIILMERSSSLNVAQSAASSVEDMTGMIAFYFNSTFEAGADTNDEWPQGSGDLNPEITTDGFYHLRNESPGTAGTSIFNPEYRYEDVAIDLEGALTDDSQRASAYGIVFNYRDQDNYKVFAVDGAGRYSLWTRADGVWRELRGDAEAWTLHEAVLGVGENNHLRIEIHGSHYLGYVNDTLVVDVIDNTAPSGGIGIYLATPDSGTAGALIDRYSVAPSSGSTPSMTGSES